MNPTAKQTGARIRQAREAKGLTQAELAAIVGTGQSKIAGYETGAIDMSLDRFCNIAIALGLKPSELLELKTTD